MLVLIKYLQVFIVLCTVLLKRRKILPKGSQLSIYPIWSSLTCRSGSHLRDDGTSSVISLPHADEGLYF